MKLRLLTILTTFFIVTGCSSAEELVAESEAKETVVGEEKETEESLSQEEIFENAINKDYSDIQPRIEFTKGIDEYSNAYADILNYVEIAGEVNNAGDLVVIYENTVIDSITIKHDGTFTYNKMAGEHEASLIFATDTGLLVGDNININELDHYREILIIPKEDLIIPKEDLITDNIDNKIEIGTKVSFVDNEDNEFSLTVESFERYDGDNFHSPSLEYFVRIDFIFENLGNEVYKASVHGFSMYDGEGFKAESISKDYFSEDIIPGKKASGTVYFDVMNDGPFELYYGDVFWLDDIQ